MIKSIIVRRIIGILWILLIIFTCLSETESSSAEAFQQEDDIEIAVWVNIKVNRGGILGIHNVSVYLDDQLIGKIINDTSSWIRTSTAKGLHYLHLGINENNFVEIPLDLQEAVYLLTEITVKMSEIEIESFDAVPRYATGNPLYDNALKQYDQKISTFLGEYDSAYSGDGYFRDRDDPRRSSEKYISSYVYINKKTHKYARIQDGQFVNGLYYETEISKGKDGKNGIRYHTIQLADGTTEDMEIIDKEKHYYGKEIIMYPVKGYIGKMLCVEANLLEALSTLMSTLYSQIYREYYSTWNLLYTENDAYYERFSGTI